MTNEMNELYKDLFRIERMASRGFIPIKECNNLILEAIEKRHDEWMNSGCTTEWDSAKAYHSAYLRLARLTK